MKDPAFLFYSKDWISGTITMTFEDRGKYIHILAMMHQQGRLSEETIRFLVGSVSVMLQNKFEVDADGLWYNVKLESEIEKRANFVDSRRENGQKGGRPKKPLGYPNDKPLGKPTHNLSVNVNVNEDLSVNKGVEFEILGSIPKAPDLEDFQKHFADTKNNLDPKKYTDAYQYYILDGSGMDAKGNRVNIHNFKQKVSNLAESKGWMKEATTQPIKIKMNDGR